MMARALKGRGKTAEARPLTGLEAAILSEGERRIAIRQDGVSSEMQINGIIARKIAETAAKGSAHAQRLWSELHGDAERTRRQQIDGEIAVWRAYQSQERVRIAASERAGTPLPAPLPHPDDLEFDREQGVRFTGPVTEEEVRATTRTVIRRDLLILQHAHDSRAAAEKRRRIVAAGPTSALLLAHLANSALPKRLQLSADGIVDRMMAAAARPKRELLKELHRGWKRLGEPLPRGTVLPPIEDTREALTLLGEVLRDLRARPTPGAVDFEDAARELILGTRAIGRRRRAMNAETTPPPKPDDR